MEKITQEIADEIRRLKKEEHWTYEKLAEKFGISQTSIGSIIRNETWNRKIKNLLGEKWP